MQLNTYSSQCEHWAIVLSTLAGIENKYSGFYVYLSTPFSNELFHGRFDLEEIVKNGETKIEKIPRWVQQLVGIYDFNADGSRAVKTTWPGKRLLGRAFYAPDDGIIGIDCDLIPTKEDYTLDEVIKNVRLCCFLDCYFFTLYSFSNFLSGRRKPVINYKYER